MRLKLLKNVRLSTQLFALVAVSFLIAMGLIAYAMQQVRSTQGTLKHTIDNRMVSGQSLQGVADAELMKRVTRDADYTKWTKEFLGG